MPSTSSNSTCTKNEGQIAQTLITALAPLVNVESPAGSVSNLLELLGKLCPSVQFVHETRSEQEEAGDELDLGPVAGGRITGRGPIDELSEATVDAIRSAVVLTQSLLETRLVRLRSSADELTSIRALAGGVAGYFNNLHTTILGHSALLLSEVDCPDLPIHVRPIMAAARSASTLSRKLLAFAGRGQCRRQRLRMDELVHKTAAIIRQSIGTHIKVEVVPAAGESRLDGDAAQLEDMLLQLALNARDSMPLGGTLTLRTKHLELSESSALCRGRRLSPGRHLRLQVIDSGSGMNDDVLIRATDPFFSTKAPGTSTGLGLSAALGIAVAHQGHLSISSLPGVGTTVEIYLPLAEDENSSLDTSFPVPLALPGKRILVIESNEEVLELNCRTLSQLGYLVEGYADVQASIDRFAESAPSFDLVILDLSLPSSSDLEALEAFVTIVPHANLLVTTAGDLENARGSLSRIKNSNILPKPFTPAQIGQAVLESLLATRQATLSEVAPACRQNADAGSQ